MTLRSGGVLLGRVCYKRGCPILFPRRPPNSQFQVASHWSFQIQIEIIQSLPLWKFGAAYTVTERVDMELPATGWINCLTVCLMVGWPVGAHRSAAHRWPWATRGRLPTVGRSRTLPQNVRISIARGCPLECFWKTLFQQKNLGQPFSWGFWGRLILPPNFSIVGPV